MTHVVHPKEILITACIVTTIMSAIVFISGYALGHREMGDLRFKYELATNERDSLTELANSEGWWQATGEPTALRINAECRGNASDWATIEMANEIGYERNIPVFVHGTCLTHEVVNVPKSRTDKGDCHRLDGVIVEPSGSMIEKCSDGTYHEITNVPQPEGR